MSARAERSLGLRLYRRALSRASRDFQTQYLDETVEALQMAIAGEREKRGHLAAVWLWCRSMVDAFVAAGDDRRASNGPVWRGVGQDLRHSLRGIVRARLYSVTVIVTLALAIGGVTAIFQLADPMLFRRLPFPKPEQLVSVNVKGPRTYGMAQFADYSRVERAAVFERMGTFYGPVDGELDGVSGDASLAMGYAVTDGFLEMLGLPAQRGRFFSVAEYEQAPTGRHMLDDSGSGPVIITDGLWASQFGRREDIIGQHLVLGEREKSWTLVIVGVLPRNFVLPDAVNEAPKFLVPGRFDEAQQGDTRFGVDIFGRLRADRSADASAAALSAILSGDEKDFKNFPQGRTARLVYLQESLFRRVRVPLSMLLAVAMGVLVLAVGNLAHLSMARAAERSREIAVRAALGGGAWRIARLLIVEATVLTAVGTTLALALSQALFAAVMAVVPDRAHLYRLVPAEMNVRVVCLALSLATIALLTFGVLPALRVVRIDLSRTLQKNSRGSRGRNRRANVMLTTLQAGLATSVLVVTLLLAASFVRMQMSVKGINETDLLESYVELPREYDDAPVRAGDLIRAMKVHVEKTTGQPVGLLLGIPGLTMPGGLWPTAVMSGDTSVATSYPMDRTALDAFQLQLVSGRFYTADEADRNAPVAVIDRRAAELLSPGRSPLGHLVYSEQTGTEGASPREVVGVVESVRVDFKAQPEGQGFAFMPIDPRGRRPDLIWRRQSRADMTQALRAAIHDLEPRGKAGARELQPFEFRFGEPRLLARMIGVLGTLILLLTITGVYSVINHATAGRTGEIGVRMALGATAARLRTMIIREALWPAVAGVVTGLAVALWWSVRLKEILFQVDPRSPVVLICSAALVLVVVIIAAAVPAARASRINPIEALRAE